jgi:hypothetical protein
MRSETEGAAAKPGKPRAAGPNDGVQGVVAALQEVLARAAVAGADEDGEEDGA